MKACASAFTFLRGLLDWSQLATAVAQRAQIVGFGNQVNFDPFVPICSINIASVRIVHCIVCAVRRALTGGAPLLKRRGSIALSRPF